MSRESRFNAFDMNCVGHQSPGLWAHPRDRSWQYKDLEYWVELAEILERGRRTGVIHFEDARSAVHAIHMLCAGWAMGANNLKGTDKETYWREIAAIVEGRFFGSANGASTTAATR